MVADRYPGWRSAPWRVERLPTQATLVAEMEAPAAPVAAAHRKRAVRKSLAAETTTKEVDVTMTPGRTHRIIETITIRETAETNRKEATTVAATEMKMAVTTKAAMKAAMETTREIGEAAGMSTYPRTVNCRNFFETS
jgi:hypothetical protein